MTDNKMRIALRKIQNDLNRRFRKRETVVETMIASMLAGELVLLIGPRGEAKTAIVEALSGYISDGTHFSVGLAKSSTPDDILGGVDVVALQSGVYRRNVEGFLPKATTFLLDEGFKANNPTLQSLLRVLSEREFQGESLPCLFGAIASNELPPELRGQKNGKTTDLGPFEDSLLAFFDRFFHKIEVEALQSGTSDWEDVVFGNVSDTIDSIRVTVDEIRSAQRAVFHVALPETVRAAIRKIAGDLARESIHVSTRTWRKAMHVLRAHAWLDSRDEVRRSDLRWLAQAFWTTPDQRRRISEIVSISGSPELGEALSLELEVSELMHFYGAKGLTIKPTGEIEFSTTPVSGLSSVAVQEPLTILLRSHLIQLRQLETTAEPEDGPEMKRVIEYIEDSRTQVVDDMLKRLRSL